MKVKRVNPFNGMLSRPVCTDVSMPLYRPLDSTHTHTHTAYNKKSHNTPLAHHWTGYNGGFLPRTLTQICLRETRVGERKLPLITCENHHLVKRKEFRGITYYVTMM